MRRAFAGSRTEWFVIYAAVLTITGVVAAGVGDWGIAAFFWAIAAFCAWNTRRAWRYNNL